LGLGGSEARFPPELFARAFERARQAGLPRVPRFSAEDGLGIRSVENHSASQRRNRLSIKRMKVGNERKREKYDKSTSAYLG